MYRLLPNPNSVLVTGCSAGGYGAMMYAPYIMAKYVACLSVLLWALWMQRSGLTHAI